MNVVCVIADLVKSREIADRGGFQKRLERVLSDVSRDAAPALLSPYTITLGDEFQAVYRDFSSLFVDAYRIVLEAHPTAVRFSVAAGALSTDLNPRSALGMDGPAFHAARAGMDALKKRETTIFSVAGFAPGRVDFANSALGLFASNSSRWNKTALAGFVCLLRGLPKKELPAALGAFGVDVKLRTVYKTIRAHDLDECVRFHSALAAFLDGAAS